MSTRQRIDILQQKCLDAQNYKVAASYLLVLHNLESLEQSGKVRMTFSKLILL